MMTTTSTVVTTMTMTTTTKTATAMATGDGNSGDKDRGVMVAAEVVIGQRFLRCSAGAEAAEAYYFCRLFFRESKESISYCNVSMFLQKDMGLSTFLPTRGRM